MNKPMDFVAEHEIVRSCLLCPSFEKTTKEAIQAEVDVATSEDNVLIDKNTSSRAKFVNFRSDENLDFCGNAQRSLLTNVMDIISTSQKIFTYTDKNQKIVTLERAVQELKMVAIMADGTKELEKDLDENQTDKKKPKECDNDVKIRKRKIKKANKKLFELVDNYEMMKLTCGAYDVYDPTNGEETTIINDIMIIKDAEQGIFGKDDGIR